MNVRPLLIVTGLSVAVQVALAGYALTQLPADARIAIHWGIDGRADGFAEAWFGVLLLPAVTALLGPILAFVPRFDPRFENLARSASAYRWIVGSALVFVGAIQVLVVGLALGWDLDVATFTGIGIGILFVIVGNFLGKTRSSWFLGIRTPWTLSSDRSWTRTHRLGSYLFIGVGALTAVTALAFGAAGFFWVLMTGVLGSVALLFVYSYFAWRDDPDRQTL